jgi:hypothetical protein
MFSCAEKYILLNHFSKPIYKLELNLDLFKNEKIV